MGRHWTLNDAIQHHKHGFVAESSTVMTLSYKRNGSATTGVIAANIPLNLNTLLQQDLVRLDRYRGKNGFRLRFLHDTSTNGIYVQRDESSPRQFVATVPSGLL
jgi:hypothetical protein